VLAAKIDSGADIACLLAPDPKIANRRTGAYATFTLPGIGNTTTTVKNRRIVRRQDITFVDGTILKDCPVIQLSIAIADRRLEHECALVTTTNAPQPLVLGLPFIDEAHLAVTAGTHLTGKKENPQRNNNNWDYRERELL
jgi:hypothetical protein